MPCYWQIEDWDNDKAKWIGFSGNYPSTNGRTIETHEHVVIGVVFEALPESATIQLTAIPNKDMAESYASRTVQLSWTLG